MQFKRTLLNGTLFVLAAASSWRCYYFTKEAAVLPAFSRLHLPIGGGEHIINATKAVHGPSWRMVVSLTPQTEAYGIYPGGQNGNPGSKFYDNGIDKWVQGEYYTLWVMTKNDINDNRVKSKIVFKRG